MIDGDRVFCSAYSHELLRYGVKVGLTNYAAAYCTGLLCARRVLQKLNLDKLYVGVEKADGEDFNVESNDGEKAAFRCHLDVGLSRTSTGANIFGVLKGAVDGGLAVPHSNTRFPGYDMGNRSYEPDVHRARIFGHHVSEYMKQLQSDNEDYLRQFGRYAKNGITADNIESMYVNAHAAIRANPAPVATKEHSEVKSKHYGRKKLSLRQRRERVRQKKALYLTRLQRELAAIE